MNEIKLTPQLLLQAYANGYFPMAESRDDPQLYWFSPELRGIIPLKNFHTPRSLKKAARQYPYRITTDTAFERVISACAEETETRPDSWINPQIIALYTELHKMGHAHSMECWEDNTLVGGLYGVSVGAAFCGESMFSRKPNASKLALVALVEHLRKRNYTLLDTQYTNAHLLQFGNIAISKQDYMRRLHQALKTQPKQWHEASRPSQP